MKTLVAVSALAMLTALAAHAAPALAADKLVAVRLPVRHQGEVFEIQFSADSRYAVTTSTTPAESGTLDMKVWRVPTGEVVLKDEAVKDDPPFEVIAGQMLRFEKVEGGSAKRVLRVVDSEVEVARLVDNETVLHVARSGTAFTVVTHIGGTNSEGKPVPDVIRVHTVSAGGEPRAIALGGAGDEEQSLRMTVSRDGSKVAYALKATAVVVDVKSGKVERIALDGPADELPAVGISDDGATLYTLVAGKLEVRRAPDFKVQSATKLVDTESMPRWRTVVEVKRGEMVELTGTRANAFVDLKSGKTYWAARGSSVNRYRMDAVSGDLILRASRSRSNPTTWGLLRRAGGDFKEVYKLESRVALGSLTTSRNGRCLTLVTNQDVAIVDPVTRREIGKATGVPQGLYRGAFSPNGRMFVVGGDNGEVIAIQTPTVCHG